MISPNLEEKFTWIVSRRRLVIGAMIVLTLLLAALAPRLKIIINPDQMLPPTHPYVQATKEVDTLFGHAYPVVVALTVHDGTVFTTPVLRKLRTVTDALEKTDGVVPGSVVSIATRDVGRSVAKEMRVALNPFMAQFPESDADLAKLRDMVLGADIYRDLLVSKDLRTAAIFAEFRPDSDGFLGIEGKLEAATSGIQDADTDVTLAGQPMFLALLEHYSTRMLFLFPIALVVIGLVHFEAFRSVQAIVLPLLTALVAVVWALGLMSLMGVALDVFNAATPILILAIAAGHAVQILKRYYEELPDSPSGDARRNDVQETNRLAVIRSLAAIAPVTLAAGLTATLCFMSLALIDIPTIRTFGIFTGLGIACALIIELTLIPAIRASLAPPLAAARCLRARKDFWSRSMDWLAEVVIRRRPAVAAVSLAILALAAAGASRVVIDNSIRGSFAADTAERLGDAQINAALAGTDTLYVLISTPYESFVTRPETIRAIAEVESELAHDPKVGKVISSVDFLREADRVLWADNPPSRSLKEEANEMSSLYGYLSQMADTTRQVRRFVDAHHATTNMTLILKDESSRYVQDLAKRIEAGLRARLPAYVDIGFGGSVTSAVALNDVIVRGKLLNIVQILGVVFVISALLFRSPVVGAMVLTPLVATVAANFGLMGWLGIPLNVPTATSSAMAVGIGADYAIYFLYRWREELRRSGDPEDALRRTYRTAGAAILFVALAVGGGYAVLMLSRGFLIHIWLGLLITLAMIVSALAALTILPALALSLRPRFVGVKEKPAAIEPMAAG